MIGMFFGEYHTYDDFNLLLSEVNIPPAEVKTNFVDIPGGDGSADLTAALGRVNYKDRECKFTLSVLPSDNFEEKKTKVSNALNGRRFRLVLDKDPGYYYMGRCLVSEYKSSKKLNTIVVAARVSPYKYKMDETVVVYPAGVTGQQWLSLACGVATVPVISTTAETVLTLQDGSTWRMNPGNHTIPAFELQPGQNVFGLQSAGQVTIKYQERDL